jgi:ribosomal subunit interface protein
MRAGEHYLVHGVVALGCFCLYHGGMEITIIENQNVDLPATTKDYIEEKLSHLKRFAHDESASMSVEVFRGGHGGYETSVTLKSNGDLFHAKAVRSSVNEGVDEVEHELAAQLKRAQGKARAILRKGGDMMKNMMRFGRG